MKTRFNLSKLVFRQSTSQALDKVCVKRRTHRVYAHKQRRGSTRVSLLRGRRRSRCSLCSVSVSRLSGAERCQRFGPVAPAPNSDVTVFRHTQQSTVTSLQRGEVR